MSRNIITRTEPMFTVYITSDFWHELDGIISNRLGATLKHELDSILYKPDGNPRIGKYTVLMVGQSIMLSIGAWADYIYDDEGLPFKQKHNMFDLLTKLSVDRADDVLYSMLGVKND